MEEAPFATEDALQALIADHPELLDGKQMRPGDPRRWILVTREKGIAESVDSGSRWALDHLLVDQDAVPTLVEVKRGRNPEIRRAVVGQMLEWGMGCGIIKAPCPRADNPVSVAWLFVPGGHFRYQSEFTFGSRLSEQWPPDRPLRELLERWADQFSADAFTDKKVGRNWVVGYDAAAEHIGLLEDRLATVLSELKEL